MDIRETNPIIAPSDFLEKTSVLQNEEEEPKASLTVL